MIKINLQSVVKEFEIGGTVFTADFSDAKIQGYFEYGQDLSKLDEEMAKQYPNLANEQEFNKVADAIINLLPKKTEGLKGFFDKCFGEGKGEEVYSLCGQSTPNLQLVFQAVWAEIVNKMMNQESEAEQVVNEYKPKTTKKNKK